MAWFWRLGWMGIGFLPLAFWALTWARMEWLKSRMPSCVVHEGFARNCVLDGVDRGDQLYGMYMSVSWGFVLVTLPVTVVWSLVIFVVLLVRLIRYLRRKPEAE